MCCPGVEGRKGRADVRFPFPAAAEGLVGLEQQHSLAMCAPGLALLHEDVSVLECSGILREHQTQGRCGTDPSLKGWASPRSV